jgi:hypothetical protein
MKTLTHRSLGAVIILLVFAAHNAAQQTNRLVDWQSVEPDLHPKVLKIVAITANRTPITTGEPFSADEDWLDKLTFRLRNVSDKTITAFQLGLAFPELGSGGSYPDPAIPFGYNDKPNSEHQESLSPGSEVALTIPADKLAMLRVNMQRRGKLHLTRANILRAVVTFSDGLQFGGISLRKD